MPTKKLPMMPITPAVVDRIYNAVGKMFRQKLVTDSSFKQTWGEKVLDPVYGFEFNIYRIDSKYIYEYTLTRTYRHQHGLTFKGIVYLCSEMIWAEKALKALEAEEAK